MLRKQGQRVQHCCNTLPGAAVKLLLYSMDC